MLCLNKLLCSFVETDGFRVLMSKACPNYEIPGRKFFAITLIPNTYEKTKAKVMLKKCVLTTFGHHYISITAHCHDHNFEKHHLLLEMMPFEVNIRKLKSSFCIMEYLNEGEGSSDCQCCQYGRSSSKNSMFCMLVALLIQFSR
ncbi:hypothetical protein PR048_032228 [Dryococelus australis]|uniref:Uncharacterized protein n=1 Tax=Dryococelus australis TaxID=614101 RepID=A0ABQ9G1M5_9NEOP|nr:hypothetical protein PR048_032228 [Dryococelus australis]